MSEQPAPESPLEATTSAPPDGWSRVAGALAIALQTLVAFATLMIGAFGGTGSGVFPVLAIGQAMLGAAFVIGLVSQRDRRAILVPLISGGLTALLMWMGTSVAGAAACSDQERALVGELAPPPGVVVDLRGASENRCSATLATELEPDDLVTHYRSELDEHGWQVVSGHRDPQGGGFIAAFKDGHEVAIWSAGHEGGPAVISIGESPLNVTPRTCSEAETKAITRLTHPAGVTAWPPWGEALRGPETEAGCVTRFSLDLAAGTATPAEVVALRPYARADRGRPRRRYRLRRQRLGGASLGAS